MSLQDRSVSSNRMFGSVLSGDASAAPKVVKRIVSRKDTKATKQFEDTLRSCKLIVYDLHTATLDDIHFLLRALRVDPETGRNLPGSPAQEGLMVVLISSVMV